MLSLLAAPFAACLILAGILGYFGVHILEREVIFVDLALGQIAALGGLLALLAGYEPHGTATYAFSLTSVFIGAGLFSLARFKDNRVPQEAIIGIVYVVASAAAILVADRVPGGGEAIKDILVGSLLWVTWPAILKMAAVYAALGVFHFFLRKRFLTISFEPEKALANGWRIRWWDFWFYLSFGVVITFSVPIAGVLLVFSFLVVPAAIAFQFSTRQGVLAVISWLVGIVSSAAGLAISFKYDLPTGPVIVCAFGAMLTLAFLGRRMAAKPA